MTCPYCAGHGAEVFEGVLAPRPCGECGGSGRAEDVRPAGRCARCRENTVLERVPCETCEGSGIVLANQYTNTQERPCNDCEGRGYTESTPCCSAGLVDEG